MQKDIPSILYRQTTRTDRVIREGVHDTLNKMLNSERPEFLALYGRRRVGKTFTICDRCEKQKDIIFFDVMGSKNSRLLQIYMVTGGIPYYLINIDLDQSAAQAIEQLAFKNCPTVK